MIRPSLALVLLALPALAHAQLNMYCSSPNTAWCQGMAVGFEKVSGAKVAVIQKATGEMLAQVKAEKAEALEMEVIWYQGPDDKITRPACHAMLNNGKHGVPDMRLSYDNDLRFLAQFR